MTECIEAASDLAEDEPAPSVARHLAVCTACRATRAALALARSGSEPRADLWPRVWVRIAERDAIVRIAVGTGSLGATVAAAAAVLAIVTSLTAEPGRLLAVLLGMV